MNIANKKGAIEMSISTIVIVVIAVVMLILGIVFVRSAMCKVISLTGDINDNVKNQITQLFGSTGGEVQCLGSGDAVTMVPGKTNVIYCGIKAAKVAKYSIELTSYSGTVSTKEQIEDWLIAPSSWEGDVSPGDELPKKAIRINLPDNAPEENLMFQVTVKRDGTIISSQDLDFKVNRVGAFRAAMC